MDKQGSKSSGATSESGNGRRRLSRAEAAVRDFVESGSADPRCDPDDPQTLRTGPGVRLFSALTGERTEAIQSDPRATLRGLRKLGGDLSGLVRKYFSTDPTDREAARQRLRGSQETLHEHGTGGPEPESSAALETEVPPPEAGGPAASETPSDEATGPTPDPGEVFRNRLRDILEEAVSRLEDLADEVIPDSEKEESSSD